jgi:pimeloyl-ACP methyl ester carboxylesterase
MPHFPLKRLVSPAGTDWRDTRSLLSLNPTAATACVFVHGWGGDAMDTWAGFPSMIQESPRAEGVDFYFFDYDSLKLSTSFSAALLRQFLDALLADPVRKVINPALLDHHAARRDQAFGYRRLVVCAHSLGAVISRRAILDLESQSVGRFCALDLQMLLFAPAHKGTDLVTLGRDVLNGSFLGIPLAALKGAVLAKFKSLVDLEVGSTVLQALEGANSAARGLLKASGRSDDCFRARVFHAQNDDVVRQEPFDADHPLEPVLAHTHTTICKPTPQFKLPIERLEALL